jgi:hypothetical protein
MVYIYAAMYEKSPETNKYHLNNPPVLIGKIKDESISLNIISILPNTQGSTLAVQYEDGSIKTFEQKFSFWKEVATVSLPRFSGGE